MAFGLKHLTPRQTANELQQLNLHREAIFNRNLILIIWVNDEKSLDEFRDRAPDFWDWKRKVLSFTTVPALDPIAHPHWEFYHYLDWLIDRNLYLRNVGVMQVQSQVAMPLDQVYVSLQAEREQQEVVPFRKG